MSERPRCPKCVERRVPKPLFAAFSDGRCFNHSQSPEALERRKAAGARGGQEAAERKAKRIAGPKKGKGIAAKDAPDAAPPVRTSEDELPAIDFSSPDAVTATMERVGSALLAGKVHPDNATVFVKFCEVAQKVRAPRGGGSGKGEKAGKVLRFVKRAPPPAKAPEVEATG